MSEAGFVFFLIGVSGLLMASNRVRFDLVAIIVVVALIVSGTLPVDQALSGFGSPVVIMVAALLIIGEMLDRTGVAHVIGNQILKIGGNNEAKLLVLLMLGAALLGCFMSSTAIVAIFIPIILRIAIGTGINHSRLLLPMSYAALISGMLTLIATPPNLVVSDSLTDYGYAPLGFFSFFPIGIAILFAAIVYVLMVVRPILGKRADKSENDVGFSDTRRSKSAIELLETFNLTTSFWVVKVLKTLNADNQEIFSNFDARILARRRPSKSKSKADAFSIDMQLRPDDLLLVNGSDTEVKKIDDLSGFQVLEPITEHSAEWDGSAGIAEVLIHPESKVVNSTVRDLKFRSVYGVDVLGIIRGEEILQAPLDVNLKAGDRMLIVGRWDEIEVLTDKNHDFVLLHIPSEKLSEPPAANRYFVSIAILAAMVLLSVSGLIPIVVAVILAATAAVVFRTISADRAYSAIHWSSIVLVAGMLPLADALELTGGADLVVDALFLIAGESTPQTMMALLFALTAVLGLVLSNTATAVLLAPIAIRSAETLDVSPYPFAICVLMAASAAFSTPVSTPVVTLVVAPGGYKFADFLKIGIPLTLVVGCVTVFLTPVFFPL